MHNLITHLFWQTIALRLSLPIEDAKTQITVIDHELYTGRRSPAQYSDILLECVKYYRQFKFCLNE